MTRSITLGTKVIEYTRNNDKIIDSYITIKLVDTNNHTSYVRTKITDDMKQTFAAELHY